MARKTRSKAAKKPTKAGEAAGFTQASFGDTVGINTRVIIHYESDQAVPSVRAAAVSLDALAGLVRLNTT